MAKDPVCGMEVSEKNAAATAVYQGRTYYFCSPACKRSFEKDPVKYVSAGKEKPMPHGHRGHCC